MTKNAKTILELINNSTQHLTAEQIYLKMKEASGKIVMATVYNNLNYLCGEGLIHKVVMENAPDCYDKIGRHDHLICNKCGRISDLYLEDMTLNIEKKTGIKIHSYDLKIYYVCENCKEL